MNLHQTSLRDDLCNSTELIDNIIEAANNTGALGAKIVGSGGGGCVVALVPDESPDLIETVITAMKSAGAVDAYQVRETKEGPTIT